MPKKNISLLNDATNIIHVPQSKIDSFAISNDDIQKIIDTMRLFLVKVKDHFAYDAMKRQYDNKYKHFDFVSIPKYPMAAVFNSQEKRVVINVGIWGRKNLLNVPPQDIYAVLVYGFVCAHYSVRPLNVNLSDDISDFMSTLFIRIFAKKYGLLGSYSGEIPKLRYLVTLYTLISFFNMSRKQAILKASHLSKINDKVFDINLDDYDFSDTKRFIECLSDSDVLHGLNVYEFASKMIRLFGSDSLAMFEDGMRFMATIAGSSILGTTIFPITLQKFNYKLYNRLLLVMQKSIK